MISRNSRRCVAAGLLALLAAPVVAARPKVDMLQVGQPLARFDLIKPGVHRYARYMIVGEQRKLLDIWTRRVSFETENGKPVLRVHQRWDAADKSYVALFDQTFETGSFRPRSQAKTVTRDGVTKTQSVRFDGAKVDSIGDGEPGAGKPVHEAFSTLFYNWHTDMEFLQALPLAPGYAASIPFYDVGLEPPARYTYAVTGEDKLRAADGTPIKCWVMEFRGKPSDPSIRYWISKRGQILVREQATSADGILVKTLLNPEAEDG